MLYLNVGLTSLNEILELVYFLNFEGEKVLTLMEFISIQNCKISFHHTYIKFSSNIKFQLFLSLANIITYSV